MDASLSALPKPALLMRRMAAKPAEAVTVLSRDSSAPLLRLAVELARGSLVVELEPKAGGVTAIQWTQNGTPIAGQTGTVLHLAELTTDDADLYYAILTSPDGESRSQSFLVVVAPGNPLLNFSARGQVTPGKPLIAGFVVGRIAGSTRPKRYLIRVLGASLRRFGVLETLTKPTAVLHRGRVKVTELVRSDEQSALGREWSQKVGAFAVDETAAELVNVVELQPGAYSVIVSGTDGETGEVLVEVYETQAPHSTSA